MKLIPRKIELINDYEGEFNYGVKYNWALICLDCNYLICITNPMLIGTTFYAEHFNTGMKSEKSINNIGRVKDGQEITCPNCESNRVCERALNPFIEVEE